MLELSDTARAAITTLTGGGGGGLRIAVEEVDAERRFRLTLAREAEDGEKKVVAADGAEVYLDPRAADYTDDKVLTAREDAGGDFRFALHSQG